MRKIRVVDSHTGGEPTRVVIEGGPDAGSGSMAERARRLRAEHDHFRRAIVMEPRGSDVMVGGLLCEPLDPACACGVIFFNNVGYLGMCGHGTIGLVATLRHLGRIGPGDHRIETPVGCVTATLHEDGAVSIRNVASHRKAKGVTVEAPGHGAVTGDVAWGGNWFYLIDGHGLDLSLANVDALTAFAWSARQAINADYPEVDHVELFGPPSGAHADSRNFVLCPGKAYDRSPCGTGTSAKIACLAADGKLAEGAVWRQESIVGSVFEAGYTRESEAVLPWIRGSAWVNAEATLLIDDADPFAWGIGG